MNDRPSFDRGLLIPIFIGLFSIFGICLVLILGRLSASREQVAVEATATPFQYLFLGTEPAVVSATPNETESGEGTADEPPRATSTEFSFFDPNENSSDSNTTEPTRTQSSLVVLSTPTPAASSTAPLNPGTYDDNDSHLRYEGDWIRQSGVNDTFQNSLHVSTTLGNTATFRFIGQQVRLFFQSGTGLGTIEINLDGVQFELDQSGNGTVVSEWSSPLLVNGTHTVLITHLSGGSINLDQIIVPDVLLTPTATTAP
jgi:hypothetical protein